MASVIIALGVAAYFTTEKVREHKQKKRDLKAQQTLEGDVSTFDGTTPPYDDDEHLPTYHKEALPAYAKKDYRTPPGLV
ncbi:hypothetical protein FKW77_007557 [Venturia effusa]|uniref:Uncharacterized protein n=1 Tax=Venturia effusa TaxID=50376 RepID=A0A517KZQ8_9PEZI|nr:hypothetical protein FKW77_007557 [Venturia effusa]